MSVLADMRFADGLAYRKAQVTACRVSLFSAKSGQATAPDALRRMRSGLQCGTFMPIAPGSARHDWRVVREQSVV
jgi:hypothetical protein